MGEWMRELVNFVCSKGGRPPRSLEPPPGTRGRPHAQQREDKVMENVLIVTEEVDLGVLRQENGFY